jgi:hypothetical protein
MTRSGENGLPHELADVRRVVIFCPCRDGLSARHELPLPRSSVRENVHNLTLSRATIKRQTVATDQVCRSTRQSRSYQRRSWGRPLNGVDPRRRSCERCRRSLLYIPDGRSPRLSRNGAAAYPGLIGSKHAIPLNYRSWSYELRLA